MLSPVNDPMTPAERRGGAALASIFALRMLGLFLILPVFAVYARTLPSGNDVALIGVALGAYGVTQALLQLAYGAASDRFGRKPVIVFGLLLFAAGSLVAAAATDIYGIIGGRVLQGAGAISAAVTALAADLTRSQHLTKIMAMIGSSIGLAFAFSMVAAPLLYSAIGMPGIFSLTGMLSLLAIVMVLKVVPAAPAIPRRPAWSSFVEVLSNPLLLRMNFGVFVLHGVQTAMWVLLPAALVGVGGLSVDQHWKVYLPAVVASFVVMVPAIVAAERKGRMKAVFSSAIALLLIVQLGFYALGDSRNMLAFWLFLFFVAFNILEAIQPSLISRIAPAHAKGAALGIYNTAQSIGLATGGAVGGLLARQAGAGAVWLGCAVLVALWLAAGVRMNFSSLPAGRAADKTL